MNKKTWISVIMILGLCSVLTAESAQSAPVDSLKITVQKGDHLFHFSNKEGSFYVGETNRYSNHFLMGYISYRETLFSDYEILVDGKLLQRSAPGYKSDLSSV